MSPLWPEGSFITGGKKELGLEMKIGGKDSKGEAHTLLALK